MGRAISPCRSRTPATRSRRSIPTPRTARSSAASGSRTSRGPGPTTPSSPSRSLHHIADLEGTLEQDRVAADAGRDIRAGRVRARADARSHGGLVPPPAAGSRGGGASRAGRGELRRLAARVGGRAWRPPHLRRDPRRWATLRRAHLEWSPYLFEHQLDELLEPLERALIARGLIEATGLRYVGLAASDRIVDSRRERPLLPVRERGAAPLP